MICVAEGSTRAGWSSRSVGNGARPVGSGRADQPLTGLSGSALADRFRTWRGRSGRRYVFSVFRAGEGFDHLPTGEGAVVIAAVRQADGTRRKLWVAEVGRDAARIERFLARPGCELHLHLLAATPAERRAVAADLGDEPDARG